MELLLPLRRTTVRARLEKLAALALGLFFTLGFVQGWSTRDRPPGMLELDTTIERLPRAAALEQSRLAATIDFGNASTTQSYVQASREAGLAVRLDAVRRWARAASSNAEAHLLLGNLLLGQAIAQGRKDGAMDADLLLDAEISLRKANRIDPSNETARESLLFVEEILGRSP
jgi:hypothetical protein